MGGRKGPICCVECSSGGPDGDEWESLLFRKGQGQGQTSPSCPAARRGRSRRGRQRARAAVNNSRNGAPTDSSMNSLDQCPTIFPEYPI